MFEMSVAAGKLLWNSEHISNQCTLQNATISAPLIISLQDSPSADPMQKQSAQTLVCSIDCSTGAVQVHPEATVHNRRALCMAGVISHLPPAQRTHAAKPTPALSSTQEAPVTPLWLPAPDCSINPRPTTDITACISSKCQQGSGYAVHPAVSDAAIHAGAAIRSPDDSSLMVSVSMGCYYVPKSLTGDFSHVNLQLTAPSSNGSVQSSHNLVPGSNNASVLNMTGIEARPARSAATAQKSAPHLMQSYAAASLRDGRPNPLASWVPVFDDTYLQSPPGSSTARLLSTMDELPPELIQTFR